jgi:MFS family permease
MFLQSLYALSIVFFEVPTGVFADKYGRKVSLVFGAGTLVFGALIYSFGHYFWQFIIAELVWGLGSSFNSGADSAFVYDSLKQNKKESSFKKIFGNIKSMEYTATIFAVIIGGFVAAYSFRLNWVLVSIFFFFAFIVALRFREPKHYEKVEEKDYWKHMFCCFKEAFTNKNIWFLVIFDAIIAVVSRINLWFYQPYMKESGWGIALFGIIWASLNVFAIIGSKSAHRLDLFLGEKKSLWLIIILLSFSTLLMGCWFSLFGLIFIYLQQFIRGFSPIVISDYTNKHLTQEKRATLLSIQSFAGSLMFVIIGPIFGWIGDTFSLGFSLKTAGIFTLLFFLILMFWNRVRNKN